MSVDPTNPNLTEYELRQLKQREEEEALKLKKKREEELVAGKTEAGVALGMGAGLLANNPGMMNLVNQIAPGLNIQALQNDIKGWTKQFENIPFDQLSPTAIASHPLMKNPMINSFVKTFAAGMAKLDAQYGNQLSSGAMGQELQSGMQFVQQLGDSLQANSAPQTKMQKMLGKLSPSNMMGKAMAATALGMAEMGMKMLGSLNATPSAEPNAKPSIFQKMMKSAMSPPPPGGSGGGKK